MARQVSVVITEERVFIFGNWDLAQKFMRRAQKLPSMQGKQINIAYCKVFTGRKINPARVVKARQAKLAKDWLASCPYTLSK